MAQIPNFSHGILSLDIPDKESLYKTYMPYIKNSGLFVPTSRNYRLGEEVFMLLQLFGEPEKIPVTGKVIWVTPMGAQGGRKPGIGIQLTNDDSKLVNTIENHLAGALNSERRTHAL